MADKKTTKKEKKTKVYECLHYEAEYDDLGKYYWCHNSSIPCNECNAGRGYYCQQFCPGYKKGQLQGEWEITNKDKALAQEYQARVLEEARKREIEERALLKHLKERYES